MRDRNKSQIHIFAKQADSAKRWVRLGHFCAFTFTSGNLVYVNEESAIQTITEAVTNIVRLMVDKQDDVSVEVVTVPMVRVYHCYGVTLVALTLSEAFSSLPGACFGTDVGGLSVLANVQRLAPITAFSLGFVTSRSVSGMTGEDCYS